MTFALKYLPAFFFLFLCFVTRLNAQTDRKMVFDPYAEEVRDIQNLIVEIFPEIEDALKSKDSLVPFAAVITATDSIGIINISLKKNATIENATPVLVAELKDELNIPALKGEYKIIAVFYKTLVTDPETLNETDAIAIFAEHTNDDFAYLFYYPYRLSPEKEMIYGNSFGDFAPQEMFKP